MPLKSIIKIFLPLVMTFFPGTFSFLYAQKKALSDHTYKYELLKKKGLLPAPSPAYKKAPSPAVIFPSTDAATAVSSCKCMIPLDSTFSVVPFAEDYAVGVPSPPDYRNDDGYTDTITLPFYFCFYGQNVNKVFINNNGNVSIGSPYDTYTAETFPSSNFSMVAPFWADVDTRGTGSGIVYYKLTPTYLVVKWDTVGYFDQWYDKLNTFQLIMTDGSDPILPPGNNVSFCYGDMQWTTGDASSGVGGFGGYAATVGANQGNGTDYIQFGQFDAPGTSYDGPFNNPDQISWLDNKSFFFSTCSSSNIPPVTNGISICDTLEVCEGDTLDLSVSFFSPELGQITTATCLAPGVSNFSVLSNTSGNTADLTVRLIADGSNFGTNVLSFSGTDDGTPPQTTTTVIVVKIDTFLLPLPVISGKIYYCAGDTVQLDAGPGYDSYLWSTGDTSRTIKVLQGLYAVTVTDGPCSKKSPPFPVVLDVPLPVIGGIPFICGGDSALLIAPSNYDSYLWSTGDSDTAVVTGAGTYTVTVVDSNGCTGISNPVTVVSSPKPVANFSITPPGNSFPDLPVEYHDLSSVAGGDSVISWFWSFGDDSVSTLRNPGHKYPMPGKYKVCQLVKTPEGCSDTLCMDYLVKPYGVEPLNIFTPNQSGDNDKMVFRNLEYFPGSRLVVYNRWGNKMFESKDYKNDWDGGDASDGVYFYILNLSDGTALHGTVTLIR